MRRRPVLVAVLALASLAAAPLRAQSPPELRFDPFRPPPPAAIAPDDSPPDRRPAIRFEPVLRSTVVAGERSLANLGGRILALGEEFGGYRLVAVRAFDATFVKDGREVLLEVKKQPEVRR